MNKEYMNNVLEYESCTEHISDYITPQQINIIDNYIMSSLTTVRQKNLSIIFQVLSLLKNSDQHIVNALADYDLIFINQRINFLVDNKKIIAYGDTRAVRFSELTL